jgi:histone H3/H4
MLVAKSKIKDYVKKEHGMRFSASAFDAVNEAVKKLLDDAAKAADDAKRITVKPEDFDE